MNNRQLSWTRKYNNNHFIITSRAYFQQNLQSKSKCRKVSSTYWSQFGQNLSSKCMPLLVNIYLVSTLSCVISQKDILCLSLLELLQMCLKMCPSWLAVAWPWILSWHVWIVELWFILLCFIVELVMNLCYDRRAWICMDLRVRIWELWMPGAKYEGPSGCLRGHARARPWTYRGPDLSSPTADALTRSICALCRAIVFFSSPFFLNI